jgi:membrane-bound lytic murein transglycosylase D
MKEQNVESYYDLYLNDETSRYVFRILAIKYILEDYFNKKHIIDFFIGSPYEVPDTKIVSL